MKRKKLTEAELAWMAGVIDARAKISYRKIVTTTLPQISVSGSDTQTLDKLAEFSGTKITIVKRSYSKFGCTQHCKEKHEHVLSVTGRWIVTGSRATVILENVKPYIQVKVAEVDAGLLLGWQAYSKDATVQKMVELGWAAA